MSTQRLRGVIIGCGLTLTAALGGCPRPPPGPGNGGNGGGDNGGGTTEKIFHEQVFTEILPAGYQGPASCQVCHQNLAQDLIQTGHWNWQGKAANLIGHSSEPARTASIVILPG